METYFEISNEVQGLTVEKNKDSGVTVFIIDKLANCSNGISLTQEEAKIVANTIYTLVGTAD